MEFKTKTKPTAEPKKTTPTKNSSFHHEPAEITDTPAKSTHTGRIKLPPIQPSGNKDDASLNPKKVKASGFHTTPKPTGKIKLPSSSKETETNLDPDKVTNSKFHTPPTNSKSKSTTEPGEAAFDPNKVKDSRFHKVLRTENGVKLKTVNGLSPIAPAPTSNKGQQSTQEPAWKKVSTKYPVQEDLKKTAGFKNLNDQEKTILLNYIGGRDPYISVPARQQLTTAIRDKTIDLTKPDSLRNFINTQSARPEVLDPLPGTFDKNRQPATYDKPTYVKGHQFDGGTANARKYVVTVGDSKIDVFVPITQNAKAGKFHSIDEISKALGALPNASLKLVKSVEIEPSQNPQDAHWAKKYNSPGFRSYMTAGAEGIVSVYPTENKMTQDYLDGSMIHETGHILSDRKFTKTDWKKWNDARVKDKISPSTYANSSQLEDFSESLKLYYMLKGKSSEEDARKIFQNRFDLIEKFLKR